MFEKKLNLKLKICAFSEIFHFDVWAGQGKSEREALPSHMRSQSVECDGKKRGREKKPIAIGSIGSEPSNSSIYYYHYPQHSGHSSYTTKAKHYEVQAKLHRKGERTIREEA